MDDMFCLNCQQQVLVSADGRCPICNLSNEADDNEHTHQSSELYPPAYDEEPDGHWRDVPEHASPVAWPAEPVTDGGGLPDEQLADTDPAEPVQEPPDTTPQCHGLLSVLFSPFDRINRSGFLTGLLLIACGVMVGFLCVGLNYPYDEKGMTEALTAILWFAAVPACIVSAKRFHDLGWSGFSVLLFLVCGGVPILLALAAMPGAPARNRYGPMPKLVWRHVSVAGLLMMMMAGAYSTYVLVLLADVEQDIQLAVQEYESGQLRTAQLTATKVYDDARQGSDVCPICEEFVATGLWAAQINGQILLEQRDAEGAVEWLVRAERLAESLQSSGTYPDAGVELADIRIQLADALEATGAHEEATALRTKAASELPSQQSVGEDADRGLKFSRGILSLEQQQYETAEELFGQLIEQTLSSAAWPSEDPEQLSRLGGSFHNRALARYELGALNGALADLDEAVHWQNLALQAAPARPDFSESLCTHHTFAGTIAFECDDAATAIRNLTKAYDLDSTEHDVIIMLAGLYDERLEYDRVTEILGNYVADHPDAFLEYWLAVSLLRQEHDERAEIVVGRLERRHPNATKIDFLRGILHMQRGDFSAAVRSLQAAVEQNPDSPGALHNLAVSLIHDDQVDEAKRTVLKLQYLAAPLASAVRQHMAAEAADRDAPPVAFEL
jgi:tetratricopeptide (TPR) repeat protein/uncharacterized membrane protein YhaH (DUF805 family)